MERKITIEEHVLYKEDYQMKMLKANSPEGFLHVGGRGVNGSSYYDYDVSGKVSMQAMYARAKLKAEDIRHFMEQLGNVLKEAERYLLDIHCILMDPEYIFYEEGRYYFCYYPLAKQDIWEKFHILTEYMVKVADYQEEECVRLAFLLHKETMEDNYSLEKLIAACEEKKKEETKKELTLPIDKIEPNPDQPRNQFDEDTLQELADSIKQYGMLQPILVTPKDDFYEIIAGERRWRAAKQAGLNEVPVMIRKYNENEIVEIALIENIQRDNLNPIEEAMAYKRLMEEFELKQDEVATKVSKSRASITNSLRLLKLDPRVQKMLEEEMISTGHARALLAISNKDKQYEIAQKVFDEKLSVRDIEKLVKDLKKIKKNKKEEKDVHDFLYTELEESMKQILGSKVSIKNKKNNKGKIEIEYYSRDELERIVDMIRSI